MGKRPLLHLLAEHGNERRYKKGSIILQEGEGGDSIYIIMSGRLRAFGQSEDGRREITYGLYGAGDYVGEMSLDGGPRSANVVATMASVCRVITRDTLKAFIGEHPDFAFELISRVIARARMATLSAKKMATLDVYGRLVDVLRQMAGDIDLDNDANYPLTLQERATHADMAQRIGSSREMVSRLLKDLERGGYVAVEQRHIVLRRALPNAW